MQGDFRKNFKKATPLEYDAKLQDVRLISNVFFYEVREMNKFDYFYGREVEQYKFFMR